MVQTSQALHEVPRRILGAVSEIVVGKDEVKMLLMAALLSGGHVLIEGLAGTAKTLLAKTFALAIGGQFKRIQLTSDLLPTDVTGFYLYTPDGQSKFIQGPIFAHIVQADELNRTTPRTQAAFLEPMQEHRVTIEGMPHALEEPFMVIGSQLPTGGPGTYPLSEVQLDRFMFRSWSGYPSFDEEVRVISHINDLENPSLHPVTTPETVVALRTQVRSVHVSDEVQRYVVALVRKIRDEPDVAVGPSPRATIALYKGGRAVAYMDERDYVIPDDIKRLAPAAFGHRISVKSEAEMDGVTPATIIDRALQDIAVPKPIT